MNSQCQRGLTLIEILVAIALIAILAGLILPVIARSRQTSYRPRCSSHLNQIGKGLFMYADAPANGGMFPTLGPAGDPYADPDPMLALNLIYGDYVQDVRVFSCSSNPVAAKTLESISTIKNGVIDPRKTYLSPLSCSYAYDAGHSVNDSVAAIVADKQGSNLNSDNHGKNTGQNVLLGSGTVEWLQTTMNKVGVTDGAARLDDIYSLNPEIPRELDGFLRQTGPGTSTSSDAPTAEDAPKSDSVIDNSGVGQCVLIGAGTVEFRETPQELPAK